MRQATRLARVLVVALVLVVASVDAQGRAKRSLVEKRVKVRGKRWMRMVLKDTGWLGAVVFVS